MYYLLNLLSFFFRFLPRKIALMVGRRLGLFIFCVYPLRKSIALTNLKIAFPNKSESEIHDLIKLTYQHYMIVMFEFLRQRYLKAKNIQINIDSVTRDLLSSDKGLILMTAHLGNWEIIIPILRAFL